MGEKFWCRLPCYVTEDEEDGWVLRISYGGWIRHGADSKHYHAHLHIEAPSMQSFNEIVSRFQCTDDCCARKLPKVYPSDPELDVMAFLACFVPEVQDAPFLQAVSSERFAQRWRDALYVLGYALGVQPGV